MFLSAEIDYLTMIAAKIFHYTYISDECQWKFRERSSSALASQTCAVSIWCSVCWHGKLNQRAEFKFQQILLRSLPHLYSWEMYECCSSPLALC